MNEVLDFLNSRIREEHGDRVFIDSAWKDANLDSFGTVMVLADMDNEYGCFSREWMSTVSFVDVQDDDSNVVRKGLTIREVVERAVNESPKLQVSKA